jgi:hypothetical protein
MSQITELWAWIAEESTGEGIVSVSVGGQHFPAVHDKRSLIESYRPLARQIGLARGRPIRLVRFSRAEVIEEIPVDGEGP